MITSSSPHAHIRHAYLEEIQRYEIAEDVSINLSKC